MALHVCTSVSHTESFIGDLMKLFIDPQFGTSYIFDDKTYVLHRHSGNNFLTFKYKSVESFIAILCERTTVSCREAGDALAAFEKAVCTNAPAGEIALLALAAATATTYLLGESEAYRDHFVVWLMDRNGFYLVDGQWKRCVVSNGKPIYCD